MRQRILDAKPDRPIVHQAQPVEVGNKRKIPSREETKLTWREVLNDGNSFYRAVAILYLASRRETELSKALPDYDRINLCICPAKLMPLEMRPYHQQENLCSLLSASWVDFVEYSEKSPTKDYERNLCDFLNIRMVLDVLLVLYVRAVTSRFILKALADDPKTWRHLSETNICQYGKECPQEAIKAVANALSLNIEIFEVAQEGWNKEVYTSSRLCNTVSLILKDRSYGIITRNSGKNVQQNKNVLAVNQSLPEKTLDCERCPFMKSGTCFRCSMLNYESPAYARIVLNRQPPNPIRVTQPANIQKAPVSPPKQQQPAKCMECDKLLLKTETELLLCQACLRQSKVEERLHEIRSATAQKYKPSPKINSSKLGPLKAFDYIAPPPYGRANLGVRR